MLADMDQDQAQPPARSASSVAGSTRSSAPPALESVPQEQSYRHPSTTGGSTMPAGIQMPSRPDKKDIKKDAEPPNSQVAFVYKKRNASTAVSAPARVPETGELPKKEDPVKSDRVDTPSLAEQHQTPSSSENVAGVAPRQPPQGDEEGKDESAPAAGSLLASLMQLDIFAKKDGAGGTWCRSMALNYWVDAPLFADK